MRKATYIMIVGVTFLGGWYLMKSTSPVSSQVAHTTRQPDGLAILRDKSLRTTDPLKVIEAIDDVSAPFRARPATSTEPIPTEVIAALVDLLDFEKPDSGNPEFDILAGQKVYPVMSTLAMLRKPVLPALVEVLENEDAISVKSQNAVGVIRQILGDDVKVSNFLRVEASASKSQTGQERLLSAADKVLEQHKKFQNRVEN